MSLHISCNPYYLKIGSRVIDKITDEYNPPRYWFRLKISSKGAIHRQVTGVINHLWWANYRLVKNFDPLNLMWINEPLQMENRESVINQYFKPDIFAGNSELVGLMHSKLPMKTVDPNVILHKENIPDEQLPEVELDQTLSEPVHVRKRRAFPYGIYFVEVMVSDSDGHKSKKIFKVWAFRDKSKCKIRSSRFYERFLLKLKLLLRAV